MLPEGDAISSSWGQWAAPPGAHTSHVSGWRAGGESDPRASTTSARTWARTHPGPGSPHRILPGDAGAGLRGWSPEVSTHLWTSRAFSFFLRSCRSGLDVEEPDQALSSPPSGAPRLPKRGAASRALIRGPAGDTHRAVATVPLGHLRECRKAPGRLLLPSSGINLLPSHLWGESLLSGRMAGGRRGLDVSQNPWSAGWGAEVQGSSGREPRHLLSRLTRSPRPPAAPHAPPSTARVRKGLQVRGPEKLHNCRQVHAASRVSRSSRGSRAGRRLPEQIHSTAG